MPKNTKKKTAQSSALGAVFPYGLISGRIQYSRDFKVFLYFSASHCPLLKKKSACTYIRCIVLYRAASCYTVPYHATLYHSVSYRAIPCTIPYQAIPYHTILGYEYTVRYRMVIYRTKPYRAIPYHTATCYTVPYRATWYHTVYQVARYSTAP